MPKATATIEAVENQVNVSGFDFDFEQFAGDLETDSNVPYAQVQTPPNLDVAKILQYDEPYGIYLLKDQAEAVNFTPTSDWVERKITFGDGAKQKVQDGYLTKKVRFVIVDRSQLEVEKGKFLDGKETKVGDWQYEGLAYNTGIETEIGKKARDSKEKLYRNCLRCLVYFLDDNNNLLHDLPLQIKWRGGFKGTLSTEIKNYYDKVGKVYAKLASEKGVKVSGTQLSNEMRSLAVIAVEFGVHKNPDVAPFTCVTSIEHPVLKPENVGKQIEEDRTWDSVKRSVIINGVGLGKILLNKSSEAAKKVLEAKENYKDFSKPRSNRNAPKPIKIKGYFDTTIAVNFDSNEEPTKIYATFVSNGSNYKVLLNEDFYTGLFTEVEELYDTTGEVKILIMSGTIANGIVTPKTFSPDMPAPTQNYDDIPTEEFEVGDDDF